MSPSAKFPYRGIFVRRVERDLRNSGNIVDTVIMKESGNKLISYCVWWSLCIFKILFSGHKYHVLYAHFVKYSIIPFLFLPRKVLKKTVFNFHGTDLYAGRFLTALMKRITGISAMVIAPSEFFKEEIIKILELDEDKVFIFPSGGVDTNLFEYDRKDSLLTNRSPMLLGYVSSITRSKGWKDLFDALVLLKKQGSEYTCTFVGSGNEEELLKELIAESNLNDNIHFAGRKEGRDLVDFYKSIDAFVFPSERESLGLVGLEAMSCGIPVIGSDIGGIKSYLTDGNNGLLFKQGDVEDLKRTLERYKELDSKHKKEMRLQARNTAEKYDSTLLVRSLNRKFERIRRHNVH